MVAFSPPAGRWVGAGGGVRRPPGGASGNQIRHQDSNNILDQAEPKDRFGESLNAGLYGAGIQHDLAIGIPFEDLGSIGNAGAVAVMDGGSNKLTANDQLWHRDVAGVNGTAAAGDRFGASLGRIK